MALKWCTKLNVVKMSCPIVFQDHPPNFKVTRDKNRQLWHKFNVSRLQIQFEFTDGFEMIHNAWRSIEEVPYCFSRSSIKLQGHKGWQIDDLNPIWVSLLGRSQLSNPSDLPCCYGGVHERSPLHTRYYRLSHCWTFFINALWYSTSETTHVCQGSRRVLQN